ncbi:uncharacterized protein [Rutidosis leptorrhynchoides]|uniref:uncharacterized protein n=1 Tax=Rutidosis leptorrhynchoides TaxID=125765 RepID=UPI003A98D6A7
MTCDGVMWVVLGDFNEVRFSSERKNTKFSEVRAARFSKIIIENNLYDIPLGRRMYTRISDHRRKFSKLDRFLVSENFINQWPNINALVLDKKYTNHCPIMIKDGEADFSPKPIKVFDEWLKQKDSKDIIKRAWNMEKAKSRIVCFVIN